MLHSGVSVLLHCLGSLCEGTERSLDQQSFCHSGATLVAPAQMGKMPGAQACYTLPMGVSARKLVVFVCKEKESKQSKGEEILTCTNFLS